MVEEKKKEMKKEIMREVIGLLGRARRYKDLRRVKVLEKKGISGKGKKRGRRED